MLRTFRIADPSRVRCSSSDGSSLRAACPFGHAELGSQCRVATQACCRWNMSRDAILSRQRAPDVHATERKMLQRNAGYKPASHCHGLQERPKAREGNSL
jgi:hypothetical protein